MNKAAPPLPRAAIQLDPQPLTHNAFLNLPLELRYEIHCYTVPLGTRGRKILSRALTGADILPGKEPNNGDVAAVKIL